MARVSLEASVSGKASVSVIEEALEVDRRDARAVPKIRGRGVRDPAEQAQEGAQTPGYRTHGSKVRISR
jgi:poly(3-hydroxybutyrate) depolymerase